MFVEYRRLCSLARRHCLSLNAAPISIVLLAIQLMNGDDSEEWIPRLLCPWAVLSSGPSDPLITAALESSTYHFSIVIYANNES
ncbi:hypothetical protein PM082_004951 [Marasmius tenuissimus]|nr:hypothetical protein PM082_004951 [Marasmius tenuissimus]